MYLEKDFWPKLLRLTTKALLAVVVLIGLAAWVGRNAALGFLVLILWKMYVDLEILKMEVKELKEKGIDTVNDNS